MDQNVVPLDLGRMLLGDMPFGFFLEILVRTVVVYVYTLLLIRWVGGRGVAQLSLVEFLLVIALGSAVGDSLFYPDVPLLHALAVVTIVVAINKALDWLILRFRLAKETIDGRPVALVEAGRILPEGLEARDLGAVEVMAMLRREGVRNLGEVDHAYAEAGGGISLFRAARPRPGLVLVPPPECTPHSVLRAVAAAPDGLACCTYCGAIAEAEEVVPEGACAACGRREWTGPVLPPQG